MNALLLLGNLLACHSPDSSGGAPEPLVLTDEWPDYVPAGDAVYIRYDDVPGLVRATPAGVEALDLGGREALWAQATPDGRYLLVLTTGDAGVEHVLVEDGAIAMVFSDQDSNRIAASPDGRYLALWYDSALDAHSDLFVDVKQITLVDTVAGTAAQVATDVAPITVALTDAAGLVVGAGGALGLDLATQSAGEAYDFADEGIGSGWGYWGVISADDAYAVVSAKPGREDDTVVRIGLATRSVLTAQSPLSETYDGARDEDAPRLFRVGDTLFAHTDQGGLATLDPDTMDFALVDGDVHFSLMEVQADRAILYGEEATNLVWTDPPAVFKDPDATGVNQIWFGDDHAVMQVYSGGAWNAKVLDLATGDTWMQPLQDVPVSAALMAVGGAPMALLDIHGVDAFGLLPLAEESDVAPVGEPFVLSGAMANDEAFYLTGLYDDGFIAFLDPVTGTQTEYRDFTDLDLMRVR